jgi:hypothetical protein
MTDKKNPIYYTIKLEAMAPCTLFYSILATSPEEALEKLKFAKLLGTAKVDLKKVKKLSAKVFEGNSLEIKAEKRF